MALSGSRLERMAWNGEATFRALSYYFSVRWNWEPFGDHVRHVLGGFAVLPDPSEHRMPPTPGMPPVYSLIRLGPRTKLRYRLLYGGERIYLNDDPGETLRFLYWHVNTECIRRTGDFLLIHAGAVVSPAGHGVLLPADSGSGKTTLVGALIRAGFGYLSDEAGAIDPVTGFVYPYPKALAFKRGMLFDLYPELRERVNGSLIRDQWHLRAEDIRPEGLAAPAPVRLVVAHRYVEGAATRLTPMTSAECAVELGRGALNISFYRGRVLALLARVVEGARAYRMASGDLGDAVRTLEDLSRGLELPFYGSPA